MKSNKPNTWGGPRKGGGRPKVMQWSRPISATVDLDCAKILDAYMDEHDCGISEAVRGLIMCGGSVYLRGGE